MIAWVAAPVGRADPVISELMADNSRTLKDEDGAFSDWIEIQNPDSVPVNLNGWYLTDDPTRLTQWAFPSTNLAPGQFLVVFASSKNRRVVGRPLHTNFRLDADGEYLALVRPDGRTVATEFAPRFPSQFTDVSFGATPTAVSREVLDTGRIRYFVPVAEKPLDSGWEQPGYVPSAGWVAASGMGLGYDTGFASPGGNLALAGMATQSTTGFGFPASLALDGNPETFTHTAGEDNQSQWTLDLGREYDLTRIILRNRTSCCATRLRDITVSLLAPDGVTVRWRSSLLNPENSLDSPAALEVNLFDLNVGPITARIVRVERTPDPDLSGSNGQGNADEDSVLSLGEVEVYGIEAITYADFVRTDLAAPMFGKSTSVGVVCPFELPAPLPTEPLALRMRFDDGFTAWLNGVQIASSNAPSGPGEILKATAERADTDAVREVTWSIDPSVLVVGENVLALQGFNVKPDDDDFLLDAKLSVAGPLVRPAAYFDVATPGASNHATWYLGRLAAPSFSVTRGMFERPFDLVLTSPVPGATLMVTLDGSEPTLTRGTPYTGPIRVDRTLVVRARTLRDGYRSEPAITHTYLFLAQVIRQPASPGGFPARWASVTADYAMDPTITGAAAYAPRMQTALRSLPSLCLNGSVDDFFGATRGIYANPESHGLTWERPISMEWLRPDGTSEFQLDAGVRIQGGYFRDRNVARKHSLRLVFKDEYGPGRLRHDLFGEFGAAREFDTLVLRAGANDGYAWDAARDTEQFIRDEFGRRLFGDMGQPSAHGRFVHLYLNGLYWGVYNLSERPNEDFSSTYLGGEPADWDAVNAGDVKSGNLNAWNQLITAARASMTLERYQAMQGLDVAGRRDSRLPVLFDPDNYIDYMMVNIWGGNWDWPGKNFWFGRDRTTNSTGFKFYLWDFENTMGNNRDRSPLGMVSPRGGDASWVGGPHAALKGFSEYRVQFADHVQRHFFGQGVLTTNSLIARYRRLADEVESAIIAETARWGDEHFRPPQDLSDWIRERDWLLKTYLPQRSAVVLGQLRRAGLFPELAAPVVVPSGGSVAVTTPIILRTPARWLYYTLDGSDPRLPGGAPQPNAIKVEFTDGGGGGAVDPILVPAEASWRYLDTGVDPGEGWKNPEFIDGGWSIGKAQLGYGDGDEATVVNFVDTDPVASGVQKNAATYFRTTFQIANPAALESFGLEVTYDDAVVVYLNGTEIHRSANLPAGVTFQTFATEDRSDNTVETRVGLPVSLLRAGLNVVAAEVHQRNATSSDLSFALALNGVLKGGGSTNVGNTAPPIFLQQPGWVRARSWNGTEWSPVVDARFSIDTDPPSPANLVVSEFAYFPEDATTVEERRVTGDRDDFEFMELLNTGARTVDLSGVRVTGGVRFEFAPGTSLAAGARVVLVANSAAFQARYGTVLAISGEYSGRLGNEGDTVQLVDAAGGLIREFTYGARAPWPVSAAGTGFSLTLIQPGTNANPANPAHWRPSVSVYGSPGTTDVIAFNGNPTGDTDGNGRADLIDYVLGPALAGYPVGLSVELELVPEQSPPGSQLRLRLVRQLAADQAQATIEVSGSAVGPWTAAGDALEYQGLTNLGGGLGQLEFLWPLGKPAEAAHFYRLTVVPVGP